MNILDTIIKDKVKEVESRRALTSIGQLTQMPLFSKQTKSLKQSLLAEGSTGIIAEFKRKSPSKGVINAEANVQEVAKAYSEAAAGMSVLTDDIYFGGRSEDLIGAAEVATIPLLRKDFIIDEYQLYEAKAIGADVILLIAANLTVQQVKQLAKKARELQLEVLLEIHNNDELQHICDDVTLVGVNNRNLKTFSVDINTSLGLISQLPAGMPAVAESGISNVDAIVTLRNAGFKGFLIGENFMKHANPSIAFADFVTALKANIT